MNSNSLGIARGWQVYTSDGKRVGDVIEVHPHYLLVSRGVLIIRDMFLPIGAVNRTENNQVILTVDHATLRTMNLSREPQPLAPVEDTSGLGGQTTASSVPNNYDGTPYVPNAYDATSYPTDTGTSTDGTVNTDVWTGLDSYQPYEEQPTYTRAQLNGMVEVEPTVNLAMQDMGYGQPVLLVPGWPFDSSIWEPLPTLLAESARVVTFDPRGLGDSDHPWDFYSVEMLVSDLHRLVVEQSLRDITIVAWSTGALVAMLYCGQHRTRVQRLVLLNPLIPQWLADEQLMEQLHLHPDLETQTQQQWYDDLKMDRAAQHFRLLDRITHAPLSEPRRQWMWQRLMHSSHHAQVKLWDAMRFYQPYLTEFPGNVPVIIVSGEHDRLAPPALTLHLAGQLPGSRHIVLGTAGHASFLDDSATVVKLIEDLMLVPDEPELPGDAADAGDPFEPTLEESATFSSGAEPDNAVDTQQAVGVSEPTSDVGSTAQ